MFPGRLLCGEDGVSFRGPRRDFLRHSTRANHQALNRVIGPLDDRTSYARYLLTMSVFRRAVEPTLAESFPSFQNLTLSDALQSDCFDLKIQSNAWRESVQGGRSREHALGVYYVLEGAAMGAKTLYARALSLGFRADYGARHLAQQTASPHRWTEFLIVLEEEPDVRIENVLDAAKMTFDFATLVAERIKYGAGR
jgi:heme oxygenase (biliverdin-IX-beta and delta-forming)